MNTLCICIIFISTVEYCEIISNLLNLFKIKNCALHSNLKQKDRLISLSNFKNNKYNILCTTDLSSRGLDIPNVSYIINFDIPYNHYEYIHRIGRCGRIDNIGQSITFISQYDIKLFKNIENKLNITMKKEWIFDKFNKNNKLNNILENVLIKKEILL